jgi:two-component system, LytTR family, sensor kinase
MRFKSRFKLWHVAVGIIAIGIVYTVMHSIYNEIRANHETTEVVTKTKLIPNKSYLNPLHMFIYIVVFFYFTMNYYYRLLAANKGILSLLKLTGMILIVVFAYYSFLYNFFPILLQNKYTSAQQMFYTLMSNTLPMLFVSFLFAWITNSREAVKQRSILEAQKIQLESEISQANFNFLKAQINPHFLHNTLNFFYAKSLPYSPELSEGILTLSDIMRYALSKGNQKDGKAPLKDEIEHVNNVIKISQLRYSNQLKVNFEVKGSVEGLLIIPFVLITLVENAFMHGDLKNQEYPIDIRLDIKGNRLHFYCSNKKKTGAKQPSTGIGLVNIKKRLDLAYGDKYNFNVKDEPEFYTVELTIYEL